MSKLNWMTFGGKTDIIKTLMSRGWRVLERWIVGWHDILH